MALVISIVTLHNTKCILLFSATMLNMECHDTLPTYPFHLKLHIQAFNEFPSLSSLLTSYLLGERHTQHFMMGYFKLNIDGWISNEFKLAIVGNLLRNSLGGQVRGFGRNLSVVNSVMMKLWALRDGLTMAFDLGIQLFVVELYAKVVVDLLLSRLQENCLLH